MTARETPPQAPPRLPEGLPEGLPEMLGAALAGHYGSAPAVLGLRAESGGASRATWSFDVRTASGATHGLVVRLAGAGGAPGLGASLAREAALMRAAAAAGVPVPAVIAVGEPAPGTEFVVMERVEGETIPRRVLRSPALSAARSGLAAQCGRILAAIHRMPPGAVPGLTAADPVATWRGVLDTLDEPHPALEFALRRLSGTRPPAGGTVVVHGDFRNGNLIVGPDGVRAVLDWELAHLGDPLEDLGWLCAKAWRFGAPLPVGGFGGYDDLIAAYERAGGAAVDRAALGWWELFSAFKWAVMCALQARRHLTGGERSVELAALGRRVAESEWDLLRMVP
ncbi:MAG TPA: phosphotransferase family protein [Streptosporangiaceae bacterium]|nr:phosphotransferase family protein [Streptosporangiaceae bacterium]